MRHLYSAPHHSLCLVILWLTSHSNICRLLACSHHLSLSLSLTLRLCSSRLIRLQVLLCTSGTDRLIWGRWEKSVYSSGPGQEWIHRGGGAQVRKGVCLMAIEPGRVSVFVHVCYIYIVISLWWPSGRDPCMNGTAAFLLWMNSVNTCGRVMVGGGALRRLKKPWREKKMPLEKIKSTMIQCWAYRWYFCAHQAVPPEFLSGGERADCGWDQGSDGCRR